MSDDSNETTNTDTAILADFRRRCEAGFRGGGIDRALLKQVWVDAGRTERPSLRSERVHLAHAQPRPSTRFAGPPLRCGPPGDCRD